MYPFPPKILTDNWSQCLAIALNQYTLFWDMVFLAIMKQILAELSDPHPSSVPVYISSAWAISNIKSNSSSPLNRSIFTGTGKAKPIRFCCIDYICRKWRLSWSKSMLHMLFTRGFFKTKHNYNFSPSQPLKRPELRNLQGHSVWPRTKGSRPQFALDMQCSILCTSTANTNKVSGVRWRRNATPTSVGAESLCLPHRLSITKWPQVQSNQDGTDDQHLIILQKANCTETFFLSPSLMSKEVLNYPLRIYNRRAIL